MNITIKNNKAGKLSNEQVKKVAEFYLTALIGQDKIKDLKAPIIITFKKLVYNRGGYLQCNRSYSIYKIAVNSKNSLGEQLETLAHECVHLKQYFLGELRARLELNRNRAKWIKTWKGREYVRKAYAKRPWEIEAFKLQGKLAYNVLNKINTVAKPKAEVKPSVVIPQAVCDIEEKVLKVVELLNIENGNLVGQVLKGSQDKQYRIRVLKKVFDLKQRGILKEFNVNGVVWVGKAQNI